MFRKQYFVILALSLGLLFIPMGVSPVSADACDMPGEAHDDNKPSEKKGMRMIEEGATVCEIAEACDAMEIDIAIEDADQLHDTDFYKNAGEHIQDELDEYVETGRGHDNPNLVCYEVEYSVSE